MREMREPGEHTVSQYDSCVMANKRCPECGTVLAEDAGYCIACGSQRLRSNRDETLGRVWKYSAIAVALAVIAVAFRFLNRC